MDFPRTNKIHQDLNEQFGDNAKLLEDVAKKIDWHFFTKLYFAGLGVLLVSIFALIVVIKAALVIY